MGDLEPEDQGKHKLDLSGGLRPLLDIKPAHLDLRRLHNVGPEDEPLLSIQCGQQRDRAAQLQDAHSVKLLPKAT